MYVVIYLEISFLIFSSKSLYQDTQIKIITLLLSIRVYQNVFLQIHTYCTSTDLYMFSHEYNQQVWFLWHFPPSTYVRCTRPYRVMWVGFRESSDFPQDSTSCNHLIYTLLVSFFEDKRGLHPGTIPRNRVNDLEISTLGTYE